MSKSFNRRITKWVWDGNVILHEWVDHFEDISDEDEISDNLQNKEAIAVFLQAQLAGRWMQMSYKLLKERAARNTTTNYYHTTLIRFTAGLITFITIKSL
jgi:hypothetical protein